MAVAILKVSKDFHSRASRPMTLGSMADSFGELSGRLRTAALSMSDAFGQVARFTESQQINKFQDLQEVRSSLMLSRSASERILIGDELSKTLRASSNSCFFPSAICVGCPM